MAYEFYGSIDILTFKIIIMKKIYFFIVAVALVLSSVTASAQFMNSSAGSRYASTADVESVFNTFDLTYSPLKFASYNDGKETSDDDDITGDMNAFSLNWTQAYALTTSLPVYFQYGAGLQYAWKTDSDSGNDWKMSSTVSFLTVKVPVNVLYCYTIPNTSVSLMPYVGLGLHGHILGQVKYSSTYDGETESETLNFFSKDDLEDEALTRFTLNWQIGAKVAFDRYIFGVGYEGPVTHLQKDKYENRTFTVNTHQVNISLGIRF